MIPKFCPLVRPPLTLYFGFLTCLTPLSLIPHQQVPWSLQLKDSFSCPISRVANSPPLLVTCSGAPYETQLVQPRALQYDRAHTTKKLVSHFIFPSDRTPQSCLYVWRFTASPTLNPEHQAPQVYSQHHPHLCI